VKLITRLTITPTRKLPSTWCADPCLLSICHSDSAYIFRFVHLRGEVEKSCLLVLGRAGNT